MKRVYFVGIGGIGMSALARFYKMKGYEVCGYDKTRSIITNALEKEGIAVNFEDTVQSIPLQFHDVKETMVVFTPAIPKDSKQLSFFKTNDFKVLKRAEVLGELSRKHKALCIAGTHGKTTVSTLLAYLLHESKIGCNAFLGGIATNYNSNVLLNDNSDYVVIEADEFDRSFLHLSPHIAGITSMDADHLDIYGTKDSLIEAFNEFAGKVDSEGAVFLKYGLTLEQQNVAATYGVDRPSDVFATNLRQNHGVYTFDYHGLNDIVINDITLGILGRINVENATLAITIALAVGVMPDEIRVSLPEFKGIYRRFNLHVNNDVTYIDDYAHHPRELEAVLGSIKAIWPERKLYAFFQPHLYSRTNDFYEGFAKSLDIADEVILLDIYPARELPMEGVTSELILNKMSKPCRILQKDELLEFIESEITEGVLVTVGAGDIDRLVPKIKEILSKK
ncbi:MAG: UDP-N-acetylmuramate--L-alanine ligase [Marinifilaceae bacterium]